MVVQLWILHAKHFGYGQYTDEVLEHPPLPVQQSVNLVYFQPWKQFPQMELVPGLQHESQYWPVEYPFAEQLVWLEQRGPA